MFTKTEPPWRFCHSKLSSVLGFIIIIIIIYSIFFKIENEALLVNALLIGGPALRIHTEEGTLEAI